MSKELADRLEYIRDQCVISYDASAEGFAGFNFKQAIDEAIAALRSEPVAWVDVPEGDQQEPEYAGYIFHGIEHLPAGRHYLYAAPSRETDQRTAPAQDSEVMMPVAPSAVHPKPAPWILKPTDDTGMLIPSRETAKVVPVHSKSQYRRVAAQGGNPVLSRETDQRSATKTQEGLGRLWNAQQEQRESSGIRIEGSQSPGSNPAPMHGQSKTGLTGSHPGAPTSTAEPALSAETIHDIRQRMKGQWIATGISPAACDALCDMALSSLTARDEVEKMRRRVEMYRDKARGNHEAYLKLYADFVGIEGGQP